MADRNDFKLIKAMSMKRFEYIEGIEEKKQDKMKPVEKERMGFYHLIIEGTTATILNEDTRWSITDTDYNRIMNNGAVDDLGVDMIFINEENSEEAVIKLYNFKYRENFNRDSAIKDTDISRSVKFLDYLEKGEEFNSNPDSIVTKKLNQIIKLIHNTYKTLKIELCMVSNIANGFDKNSEEYIDVIKRNYDVTVSCITLDEIIGLFDEKNYDYQCSFVLKPNEFMNFELDENTTAKSYIIKLPLAELVKITTKDNEVKEKTEYDIEDIKKAEFDKLLLCDNVRGFLGNTKYNKNITATLKNDHFKFFEFNNGVTLIAEDIECESIAIKKKYKFSLKNYQIVNGGQTVVSIYNFLENYEDDIRNMNEAYILVRIFKVKNDDELKSSIAEYTNSQNSISSKDLKSLDPIQIKIEQYFEQKDIIYIRKAGSLGLKGREYKYRITMERMAQLIYSYMGYPDKVSNSKARLFEDYYQDIFKNDEFKLETCLELAEQEREIINIYNQKYKGCYVFYTQKGFYITFITNNYKKTIEEAIEMLEFCLKEYLKDEDKPEARKLIRKNFRDFVSKHIQKSERSDE